MKLVLQSFHHFFDIIDKYVHQKKILYYFKKKQITINNVIDIGSHKGTYTDLFLNNFSIKKAFYLNHKKRFMNF